MSTVSIHELKVFQLFRDNPGDWMSSQQVAKRARIAPRTARLHCSGLAQVGILDEAKVFPGFRYRLCPTAGDRPYYSNLDAAEEALS